MGNIEFKLHGVDEVMGKLQGLGPAMRKKGFRFAGRKAALVIQEAAEANALRIDDPATAEQIAKNIVVRFSPRAFKATGNIMFRVGVMGGARQYADTKENRRKRRVGASYETAGDKTNPGGDTWYFRLVEFGTSRTRAQPFMRTALEGNIGKATNEFATSVNQWLDRNLKNITKKGL
jgi:HK97 gp10 family phage protein